MSVVCPHDGLVRATSAAIPCSPTQVRPETWPCPGVELPESMPPIVPEVHRSVHDRRRRRTRRLQSSPPISQPGDSRYRPPIGVLERLRLRVFVEIGPIILQSVHRRRSQGMCAAPNTKDAREATKGNDLNPSIIHDSSLRFDQGHKREPQDEIGRDYYAKRPDFNEHPNSTS